MDEDLLALLARLRGNRSPNVRSPLEVSYDFLRETPGNKLWQAFVETPFVQDTLSGLREQLAAPGSAPLNIKSNPTLLRLQGAGGSTDINDPSRVEVAEQVPLRAASGGLRGMKDMGPEEAMRTILTHEIGHSIDLSHGADVKDITERAYGETGAQLFAVATQTLLETLNDEDVSFEDIFEGMKKRAAKQNTELGNVEDSALREITADLLETNLFANHPINSKSDFLSEVLFMMTPFAPSPMNVLNPKR